MRLKHKILSFIIFIILIIIFYWFFFGGIDAIAVKAGREDAIKGVTVTGNVVSGQDAQLTTDITGVVTEILVKTGDFVEKGQPLAYLDRKEVAAEVGAARARLNASRAELENLLTEPREQEITIAEAQIVEAQERVKALQEKRERFVVDLEDATANEERFRELYGEGAVSLRDLEERELLRREIEQSIDQTDEEIKGAQAQVRQARANLSLTKEKIKKEELEAARARVRAAENELEAAEARLENYIIKAPLSGYVTQRFVSTGDAVSPQQPLFRFVVEEEIYLSMDVEEDELDTVKTGQKALVIFDAYPRRIFEEEVYYISRQVNPVTGTFEARITRPEEDVTVVVGMTLDATIIAEEYEDALIIPADFVLEEDDRTYVFKKVSTFAVKKEIKADIFDNNRVVVREGLREGEIILKKMGAGRLSNWAKVRVRKFRK